MRDDWDRYFLNITREVAGRSTCLRVRYGAIIVDKNHKIVSTGYNGAPSGMISCDERGYCIKDKYNISHGKKTYDICYSVHAEMNALIQAGRKSQYADLYLYGMDAKGIYSLSVSPCYICVRLICNAGIDNVITFDSNVFIGGEDRIKKVSAKDLAFKECEVDIIQRIKKFREDK